MLDELLERIQLPGLASHLPSPPTRGQLVELLECAFAASLETEEGRIIAFTVSFFADQEPPFDYRFKEPLPLYPRDLARLAVALDPWRSRVCVVPGEAALYIAGLIHLGEQFAFPVRQDLSELSIRVLGPATMTVKYGGQLMLAYDSRLVRLLNSRFRRFLQHSGEGRGPDACDFERSLRP